MFVEFSLHHTRIVSSIVYCSLESGTIYPTVMIVQMIVFTGSMLRGILPPVDLYPAVVLAAVRAIIPSESSPFRSLVIRQGIAPTLAIVRARIAKVSEKANSRLAFEGISAIQFKSAQLAVLEGKSTGMYSISLDGHVSSVMEELRPPSPLVHPRQAVEMPSFLHPLEERQARLDVEKGVH